MSTEPVRVLLEVQAGLIPGQPLPEYTQQWGITSEQWRARGTQLPGKQDFATELERLCDTYAQGLRHSGLNWVQTTWIYL